MYNPLNVKIPTQNKSTISFQTNMFQKSQKSFNPQGKRGNSLDPNKSKHLQISEKNQITNLITQTQRKSKNHPVKQQYFDPILPPKQPKFTDMKTLVLDLDETLVHSDFKPFNPSDIVLSIELENMIHNIHVLVRPGVEEFLIKMAKMFEVIIFTASLSTYADPLLDILDKTKACSFRLFREQCTMINGLYVKDLKRLNRNLKDIIILDNSPTAYAFNPENGIPILSWYDDKSDRQLIIMTPFLEFLSKVDDVRNYIPKMVESNLFIYQRALNVINSYNLMQNNANQTNDNKTKKAKGNSKKKNDTNDNDVNNKEINIKIVNNNYSNLIINNINPNGNIAYATNTPKNQMDGKGSSKNINVFRNGLNYSQNNKYNLNSFEIKNQNKNIQLQQKNNNGNTNSNNSNNNILNFSIKSVEKVSDKGNKKNQIKYKSKDDRNIKKHKQLMQKIINYQFKQNRPSTSLQISHSRHLSLNQKEKSNSNCNKPILNRSTSSQAVFIYSSTATNQKGQKLYTSNQMKHSSLNTLNLFHQKSSNNSNRPKSSGRVNISTHLIPKTPKFQEKKNINNVIDDLFFKKRISNTSRHIDNINTFNLNIPLKQVKWIKK